MPKKTDEKNKPQALILLKGELVQRCMDIREKTGTPITALARTALFEWLQRHDGEPGVRGVKT
jgi:hypothetical protein